MFYIKNGFMIYKDDPIAWYALESEEAKKKYFLQELNPTNDKEFYDSENCDIGMSLDFNCEKAVQLANKAFIQASNKLLAQRVVTDDLVLPDFNSEGSLEQLDQVDREIRSGDSVSICSQNKFFMRTNDMISSGLPSNDFSLKRKRN